MTYEEFIRRAEGAEVERDLWRQMRSLYVEGGTLTQVVKAILEQRTNVAHQLANTHMIRDEDIRMAIGLQGNIRGIDNVLQIIYGLTIDPDSEATDEA
jgi:hypothetical protein